MVSEFIKLPRLYVDEEIEKNGRVAFSAAQAHYLKNVLRRKEGDRLRVFNGRNGEWIFTLTALNKKSAAGTAAEQIREQPPAGSDVRLLFAPIKKARMDFLIEKAVELGVTHLHPVLTQNTEVRKINTDRIQSQIIEAAEQCERLDLPACTPLLPLEKTLSAWHGTVPLYACIARRHAPLLSDALQPGPAAFLVGPEGGFTDAETDMTTGLPFCKPVSLGTHILRAETASLLCLSRAIFH